MKTIKQVEAIKPEGINIGGRPWVTDEYLKKRCNLSDEAIRQHCSKNRNWRSQRIKGRRYIDYTSIKINFKIKYRLPADNDELSEMLIDEARKADQELKDQRQFFITEELREAFENEYVKHVPTYKTYYPSDHSKRKVRMLAQKHAILATIIRLTNKSKEESYTRKELTEAYLNWHLKTVKKIYGKKWRLFSDAPAMSRKLKEFQDDPVKCILHGRTNKKLDYHKKNRKLNDFTIAKIEMYASDKRAFSKPIIHRLVTMEIEKANEIRVQNEKEPIPDISLSYVKYYLNKPEVRNATQYFRNRRQFKRDVERHIRRSRPEFACDVWMGDGTSSQIPYVDANGKVKRASLFVFKDVMSGKITGYDVAENEDRHNLIDALHLAYSTYGYAPYELILDNASSTKTEEFKSIKNHHEKIGLIVRYAKVGNAQDKAHVERFNLHFQTNCERLIPGYVGGGVQSKIDKDRIDDEFLKETARQGKLLSWEQLQNTIGELIAWYNDTPINGHSPNKLFENSEKKNARRLEPQEIAMMFWKNTIVTVRKQEIIVTVRKQKYIYDLSYHKDILNYNGTKVRVYYDESNFDSVFVENDRNLAIGEVKLKKQIALAKANRTDRDDVEIMKQHSHKEKLLHNIEKRAAEKARMAQEYVGPDVDVYTAVDSLASKTKIKAAEDDLLLRNYRDRKGIDPTSIKPVTPVKQDNPYLNPDYGRKPANVNIIDKKGTNEVLESRDGDRDDL